MAVLVVADGGHPETQRGGAARLEKTLGALTARALAPLSIWLAYLDHVLDLDEGRPTSRGLYC